MMQKFRKMLPSILMILFEVAVGVMLLIDPEKFTVVTFIIFGCVLVLCALVMLLRFLRESRAATYFEKAKDKVAKNKRLKDKQADRKYGEAKVSYVTLVSAIVTFALGAVFIFGASWLYGVTALLLIFYGAIMLIKGLIKIVDFVSQRRNSQGVSALQLISGIISITLGLLMMIFPGSSRDVAFKIGGISLLAEAALDIIALALTARLTKKIEVSVVEVKASEREEGYDLDNFAE